MFGERRLTLQRVIVGDYREIIGEMLSGNRGLSGYREVGKLSGVGRYRESEVGAVGPTA